MIAERNVFDMNGTSYLYIDEADANNMTRATTAERLVRIYSNIYVQNLRFEAMADETFCAFIALKAAQIDDD